jgi:outer membrane protein TolC
LESAQTQLIHLLKSTFVFGAVSFALTSLPAGLAQKKPVKAGKIKSAVQTRVPAPLSKKPVRLANGDTSDQSIPVPNNTQPTPVKPTPPFTPTPTPELELRGLTPADVKAKEELEETADEATKTSGAIFVTPEKVLVKQPVLSALIRLDSKMSPYQLDADTNKNITLRETLTTAMSNNLTLKISRADSTTKKFQYYSTIGNFLPNISNDFAVQALSGQYVSPVGVAIPIKNPYITSSTGFSQYLYKGGSILHGMLESKHQYKASQFALKGTANDVLLAATDLYYKLVLEEVKLQIRVKAVQTSEALVTVNQDMFDNGVNTQLDLLQAKYQLSRDRQKLIAQQIERRQAAVKLATALNWDTAQDLIVQDRLIRKLRLVAKDLPVSELLKIAIDNRPDLKRYEQLRLAAKEAIKVARAPLLPALMASGSVLGTGSKVSAVNPFTQTTPLSSSGVGVGSVSSASSLPLGTAGSGPKHWSGHSLFLVGMDLSWNFGGLGVTEEMNVQAAKSEARRAQLEFNRNLARTYEEVRDAYLASIKAENLIEETSAAVSYAEEGLRVAEIRLKDSVGTYLDVINAQRDLTAALVDKADALIDFNSSQARLLHAMGRLTVDTATSINPLRK